MYESAKTGRRSEGWVAGNTSANSEISHSLVNLRNRSRQLVRDNPHAHRYLHAMTNNICGAGPQPSAVTGDADLDNRINAVWKQHAPFLNADGTRLGAGALMWMSTFGWIESGESLYMRRPAPMSDGLDVPLQVELLEADMIDMWDTRTLDNGGRIINGVELDGRGHVVAYWLYKEHPGETLLGGRYGMETIRVPASEIAHLYQPTRPGQRRGVPWLSAVMFPMKDLDDYRDTERIRKKTEACTVAFVSGGENPQDNGAEGRSIAEYATDASGQPIETFEPGLIAYLQGDKNVTMNHPQGVGGYGEYVTTELRGIAAGCSLPYELLTGDLSQVNYSSIRAGMLEFHRFVKVARKVFLIPMACDPLWEWVMDAAANVGLVPPGKIPVEWATQKFESIDPMKEAEADFMTLKIGTRSLSEIIAETGRDPDDVIAQMAMDNEKLAAVDLKYEWQIPGGKVAPVPVKEVVIDGQNQ